MKELTCCFTGDKIKGLPKDVVELRRVLCEAIKLLIKEGVTNFIAGGTIGFDAMAALAVLDFRQENRNINLSLYLPYKEQEIKWSKEEQEKYYYICSQADEVIYTSEEYFKSCIYKRNKAMVDNSDCCIAYLVRKEGGTFFTFNYAKDKGLIFLNLADYLTNGKQN